MKKLYDFSKGVRGKFYRPNVGINLPIYLDDDVAEFIQQFARKEKLGECYEKSLPPCGSPWARSLG